MPLGFLKFAMGINGIKENIVIIAGKKARNMRKEMLAERMVVFTSENAMTRNEEISQRFKPPNP
jgi:hypothetical protein